MVTSTRREQAMRTHAVLLIMAVAAAVLHGARLVRVHDVAAMARVVRVADAIRRRLDAWPA